MVRSEASAVFRARRAQLGLWILVLVSGAWLVARVSKLWFGGDDWFILLDRRVNPGPGQLGLFEPHFEHWSTVPILVFRAFEAMFGVREYWPYVVLLVVVHLVIIVLLWHVMVRSAVDPWLALGFTALLAVPGVGFENLTNVWQMQLISPLALGLGALLLLPERGPLGWRDGVTSLLLTIGMACSGAAITMLGVVALAALLRRGWRVALAVAALPAIAYAWWYVAYGSQQRDVTTLSYRAVPGFVWDGLTDSLGDLVRLRALGVVIVLATFGWLVWQLTRRPLARTLLFPSVLALGAVVSLALTGWRRAAITVPTLPRYAYITLVLVLPLVAAATDWLVRRVARARFTAVVPAVTGVLLLLVVIAQVRMFDRYVTSIEEAKRVEKAAFLNTAVLERQGYEFLNEGPVSVFEPQVTVAKIAALDRDGKLPSLVGLREQDRLTVLARVELAVGPTPLEGIDEDPSAVRLDRVRGAQSAPVDGRPGCVRLDAARAGATAQLVTSGRVAVGLNAGGTLALRIVRPDGSVQGQDVLVTLDPETDQVLNIGRIDGPRDGGAVLLTLPKGTTRLCGVS
ncbi:MAG TPA: hypothetical protein VK549_01485 [Acidimicrobiia bacterium]|nr:hypothetical protein [Acidimicrobiia bacterium]